MSTKRLQYQFNQAERDRADAERRTRVNKEYERALSSSSSESESECKCKCKAKKLTPEQIAYRRDLHRRLEKWQRESNARWDAAFKEANKPICTIL